MAILKPEEISSVIKEQIKSYKHGTRLEEVGQVVQTGDGIARIYGLTNAMSGELLEFPRCKGIALNIEEDNVCAVLLGSESSVKAGDIVRLTGAVAKAPVGDSLLGRVVDATGSPIDMKGPLEAATFRPIERKAPGIIERSAVNKPLQTGIKAIDALVPIGKGQRELIIGDRQTGKTSICVDTIINQKGKNVNCVYVAIGQKTSAVAAIVKTLKDEGAMGYTVVVAANASSPAPLQFIAPYAGCAIAEEWMENGKDTLIVYDDLSKHAAAYRAMSLLLRRPPGREAYPGDIFYVHSRLLERAAKLSEKRGGGSMTALPVVETQAGDISAYIPTNIISITDGQIFLEAELFNSGQRPAINAGLSVSRVGGDAQLKGMKKVAGPLRMELARYRELAAFSRFGAELDSETLDFLKRGEIITEILKQPRLKTMNAEHQIVIFYAAVKGLLADMPVSSAEEFQEELIRFMDVRFSGLLSEIRSRGDLNPRREARITEAVEGFKKKFSAK